MTDFEKRKERERKVKRKLLNRRLALRKKIRENNRWEQEEKAAQPKQEPYRRTT